MVQFDTQDRYLSDIDQNRRIKPQKTNNYNFSRLALNGDTIATATAAFVLKEEKKVLD